VQGQARFAEADALCPLVVQEHRTVLACTENGRYSRREYNAGEAEAQPLHHPSTYSGFSSSADGSAEELRVVVSRRR
jgi:hypothetical protein